MIPRSPRSRLGTVALITATLAVPAQILRIHYEGKALMAYTRALIDKTPKTAANDFRYLAGIWMSLSLLFMIIAMICWSIAARRGQAMPQLRLTILLVANLLLAFILV